MANEEAVLNGEMVGKDGIMYVGTENFLKYACPKKSKRPRALKEVKNKDGVVTHLEVPKSDVYFQATHKLPDGSTVMLLRYKNIPQAEREAFHRAAVAAHAAGSLPYPILALSEGKAVKAPKPVYTFDSLQ